MKKTIAYIDINSYPFEKFTSGLLISIREILFSLLKFNNESIMISFSVANKSYKKIDKYEELLIHQYFLNKNLLSVDLPKLNKDIEQILISDFEHIDTFIMSTPAVFENPTYNVILDILSKKNKKVKIIAFDSLLPKAKNYFLYNYLNHIQKFDVFAVSETIKSEYEKLIGKKIVVLPNLYNLDDIIANVPTSKKYITMVNTHPIKGISILKELAIKMPKEQFLVVENWVDVPILKNYNSNILLRKFTTPVKEIYKITKMLIVPSLCEEGSSRVVIEAALNGIPVIANNIGSLSEYGEIISLIPPPFIKGYYLEGTVLYPIVETQDLSSCVEKYVERIKYFNNIEIYNNHSRDIQKKALYLVKQQNKILEKIIRKW